MKGRLLLVILMFASLFATASGDPGKLANKFAQKQSEVNDQLFKMQEIDRILKAENLTYEELALKHPDLVNDTQLSPAVDDGIFDKASDSPIGIPGFWWGFCLGWVGILIVYLSMDEGQDRKDQVKNALIGCIISAALWLVLYFAFWASLWASVDASFKAPISIASSC